MESIKTVEKKWFMIHTYSGYEKKVKDDLERKIKSLDETLGLAQIVTRVLVPEEKTVEEIRGKKKTVARKLFPGYVIVEMFATREQNYEGISYKVNSDAWYHIRNTNGVTGFVGVGSDPIPMEDEEVLHIKRLIQDDGVIEEVINVDYAVGDYVEILDDSFAGREGKVDEIDAKEKKVKVLIEMFGRMTAVDFDLDKVKKA